MCKLGALDFYYGAFLSAVVNTSGSRPVLFDDTASRRIYRMDTNNASDCYVFAKYTTGRELKAANRDHWIFNFSEAEIRQLKDLYADNKNVKLALICVKEGFVGSELAIIDYNTAIECLGVNAGVKNYRINIKTTGGQHGLRMYGSGRSDKLNGVDNTIRITRKALEEL